MLRTIKSLNVKTLKFTNIYRIMFTYTLITTTLLSLYEHVNALSNGAANTPPMGWSTWLVYGCNTQCDNSLYYYNQCVSESAVLDAANLLVSEGYADLGYRYVIIDDCWQSKTRDLQTGRLQADRNRFPNGIGYLANYLHRQNLKLGIFGDLGPRTGGGFPGSQGNFITDASTFADWGVDYIKMSGASANPLKMDKDYPEFGNYLRSYSRERPILYATSWPVFQEFERNLRVDYNSVQSNSNTWRFCGDISGNWRTILVIMDCFAARQSVLAHIAHRGAWNDPDLLVIGSPGVTVDQSKAQMAVWSIMAAPLIMSTNLRNLGYSYKAVLQNKAVIDVDQDPLGISGYKIYTEGSIDVWIRPISPTYNNQYSYAIAFVNKNEYGSPVQYSKYLKDLQLNQANPELKYYITDLFPTGTSNAYKRTVFYSTSVLQVQINPSGVAFFKAELITPNNEPSIYNSPDTTNNIIRYFI